MATTYKTGDAVVCNGFQGTVTAVTASGMLEVRLASGGVCVDASDVAPGAVWADLCKIAKSDMARARKEGSILICQTRYGTVELTYDASKRSYEAKRSGLDARFICEGTAKHMVERLASVYQIAVA